MDGALQRAEQAAVAGQVREAIGEYEGLLSGGREAIGDLLHNLVPLYIKNRQSARALDAAQALAYFAPGEPRSWMILCHAQERLGYREAALSSVYRALELAPDDLSAHQTRLYLLASCLSPGDYRAAAEEYCASLPSPPSYPSHPSAPSASRLRIGYVSADFRQHVMDRLILPLLEYHDKERFDVWCIDSSEKQDAVSERMRQAQGVTWRYVRGLSDEAVAELIHQARIDVLVDLSGLSAGNRLGVFLRRPAPLQITGIGYLPTTGAKCFDWRLADVEKQAQYTEPLWKLPTAAAPEHLGAELPLTPLPARRNGFVTFGYVNGLRKLTDECIKTFVRVMKVIPTSRLVVMAAGASDPTTARMILRRFDPVQDRVRLTEAAGGTAFCRLFSEIDVALDPWPYGGCITSFDSLYHGVPLVCSLGDRRISADAWRLQSEIGLFWALDYVDMAIQLTYNLERLAVVRASLRDRIINCPSGKPREWVASLERAYLAMRERQQARLAA